MADQLIQGTTLIEDKRSEFGKTWSCSANNFTSAYPDVDDVQFIGGSVEASEDGKFFLANVSLPHGATVTAVVVNGNAAFEAGETWTMYKVNRVTFAAGIIMASGAGGVEDTSISNEKIDNETYIYYLSTSGIDTNDRIYGARIRYE